MLDSKLPLLNLLLSIVLIIVLSTKISEHFVINTGNEKSIGLNNDSFNYFDLNDINTDIIGSKTTNDPSIDSVNRLINEYQTKVRTNTSTNLQTKSELLGSIENLKGLLENYKTNVLNNNFEILAKMLNKAPFLSVGTIATNKYNQENATYIAGLVLINYDSDTGQSVKSQYPLQAFA